MTIFVPNGESQGVTATWLLQSADEHDIDRWTIKTTRGGFVISGELAAAIGLVDGEVIPIEPSTTKTPPPEWDEPLPKPDVYSTPDGNVYLTDEAFLRELKDQSKPEVDREVIRAWAKDNGYKPADKGALKQSVIEAYHQAHAED